MSDLFANNTEEDLLAKHGFKPYTRSGKPADGCQWRRRDAGAERIYRRAEAIARARELEQMAQQQEGGA